LSPSVLVVVKISDVEEKIKLGAFELLFIISDGILKKITKQIL
jgi:hypothetical protein